MPCEVEIVTTSSWQAFSRAMKRADAGLRKEMFKAIREDVTKPILRQVRIEAGYAATGRLGAAVAAACRSVVKDSGRADQAGVRVTMERGRLAARLPGRNSEELGWWLDAGMWRHPVYGNRDAWVAQASARPGWFTATVESMKPRASAELERVLDHFAQRLAAEIG